MKAERPPPGPFPGTSITRIHKFEQVPNKRNNNTHEGIN
jgi:hypothetical protein